MTPNDMSPPASSVTYPLAATTWDAAEAAAIAEVVASGRFTMGERVATFEQMFARHLGARYAVMVNSGSSANLLAVAALRFRQREPLRAGDEVLVPAVSWATTYYPWTQYGLLLRFVDIDPETLNFDLEQLEASVTDRTRAIMAVNLLGNPNDFGRLRAIADRHELLLLEDNCEGLGAEFQQRFTGTFGLMGTFSTYFSHHISTMEGGLVVTQDEELFHLLLSLRAHGWTRQLPQPNRVCERGDDPFLESFRFVLPGYNVRPLEIEAAIGGRQLAKLPELIAERRRNAAIFVDRFERHEQVRIQRELGKSSWFGFSLVVRPNAAFRREDLV
ncbi:MAG: DegT/DnrJ/EryC1/StrS family aminotransferase, partial [Terriglobia bacterium]